MHDPTFFTSCQDNTEFISIGSNVVIAAVAQTNHRAPHQVTDPEALFNLYLVLLRSPDIFAPNLCQKRFAANCIVNDENLCAGEAWAETRYAD